MFGFRLGVGKDMRNIAPEVSEGPALVLAQPLACVATWTVTSGLATSNSKGGWDVSLVRAAVGLAKTLFLKERTDVGVQLSA